MKRRDIVIGLVILLVIVGLFYFRQKGNGEDMIVPEEQTASDVERRIEERFNVEIPDDVNKAELRDANDGDGSAIATRKMENNTFTHSVLADLPDPETGKFYQAWLVRGEEADEDYSIVLTGRMQVAKGGWVLEYSTTQNLEDHNRVLVTLESVNDQKAEDVVLEGEFTSEE
jgi:hypothetical protein